MGGSKYPHSIQKRKKLAEGPEILCRRRLVTNNFITLDDGGHTHTTHARLRFLFHADYLAHRANKYFRTSGDFRWQRQSDIELSSGAQILVDREIDTAGGDVSCFSVASGLPIYWHPYNDRQRQVISPCCSSLGHLYLSPRFPLDYAYVSVKLSKVAVPNRNITLLACFGHKKPACLSFLCETGKPRIRYCRLHNYLACENPITRQNKQSCSQSSLTGPTKTMS